MWWDYVPRPAVSPILLPCLAGRHRESPGRWPAMSPIAAAQGLKEPVAWLIDGNGRAAMAREDVECRDSFGMNWKMTAKTILVQLHHKVDTFENLNRKLVLVLQQPLLDYMR